MDESGVVCRYQKKVSRDALRLGMYESAKVIDRQYTKMDEKDVSEFNEPFLAIIDEMLNKRLC